MNRRYPTLTLLLIVASIIVVQAPAAWLAPAVERATQGAVRLNSTWGTVWNGQAQLTVQRSKTERTVLPGQLAWRVNGWRLLTGTLDAQLTLQGQTLPLAGQLFGAQAHLLVPAAQYALPASSLTTLGAPFNTLKLQGDVHAQWAAFTLPLTGRFSIPAVEISIKQLQTRITGDWVLGSYTLSLPAQGAEAQTTHFELRTLSPQDPLQLSGQGTLSKNGTPHFELRSAPASAAQRERLQALLNLLGRREGDTHVLHM